MSSSGFTDAPLSRGFVISIVAFSVIATLTDSKYYLWIAVRPHILDYRQYWRFLTWQTAYANSSEVLFAVMTVYQLRVMERLWGTRKLVSFIVSILPFATLIPPLVLTLILRPLSFGHVNFLPSGPTALIFALLAQYQAVVPYSYRYALSASPTGSSSATGSVMLTSKATSYILPLQLSLSNLPGSLLVATVGWTIGVVWRRDLLPGVGSSWRVPTALLSGRRKYQDYEGLRRRLEGEDAGSGSTSAVTGQGPQNERRRGVAASLLDQFRGAF